MKKYYIISLLFLFSILSAYFFKPFSPKNKTLGAPASVGAEGDPHARRSWELTRMADPLTGKIPAGIRRQEQLFASTLPGYDVPDKSGLWTSRGPWNVGGRTRAMAIDVDNENVMLAGSVSGGIWRTEDGGNTWAMVSSKTSYPGITSIAQDIRTGKTNVWYASTGEPYGNSASASLAFYTGNGIYKSTDGGLNWAPLTSTTSNTPHSFDNLFDACWKIACDPADQLNDLVYVATVGAVYRSSNGGNSWTAVRGGNTNDISYYTDVFVTPKGVVYVTMSDEGNHPGIWRSTDGINFVNITPSAFPAKYNRIVIEAAPSDEDQVYFLAHTPGFGQPDTNFLGDVEWNSLWKYYFKSGDGSGSGGQWMDLSSSLPTTGGQFDKYSSQNSYDITIKVKPNDTNTVFIGGTNLYRSTNGFKDATQTTFIGGYVQGASLPIVDNYLNHHPDQHGILFLPSDPNAMISYNDGGIYKTLNSMASSVVWNELNRGYLTTQFYTIAIDQETSGSNIIVGGAQDNGSWWVNSSDPQKHWVQPRSGDGSYCAVSKGATNYYFSIQNAKMMKAKLDTNGYVSSFARIDPIGGKDYLFINPYLLDPNNNNIMYMAGGKNLWRNNDLSGIPLSGNWDTISTNWTMFPDTVPVSGAKITALAVSKNPANRLYYGTSKRNVYRIDNANTGTALAVDITSGLFPVNGYVNCVAVHPDDADKVLVCFSNYNVYSLFYSKDGGNTWEKVAGNLEQFSTGSGNGPSFRWAAFHPVSNGQLFFVATSTGLYATDTLKGLNTKWIQQSPSEIGNAVCEMIVTRPSDGLVTVATHANGIFSANITSKELISSLADNNEGPKAQLSVFPNPTQGCLTVNVAVEDIISLHELQLILFDLNGKKLKVMDVSKNPVKRCHVQVNIADLLPGVYLLSVNSGNGFLGSEKIVIAR